MVFIVERQGARDVTTVAHLNSIVLDPVAYRDGAVVRVNSNHALVAYLTDLYPADGYKVVLVLVDGNGVAVDTWISPDTYSGQFWTGGSATGLYRLADNKILMLRSDWITDSDPPGYDLKAYELDFSDNTGEIPEPTIHALASEVNPPGSANDPKWFAGGVGSDSGVVLFRISGDYTTLTMHWYEWGSGSMSSAFQTITGLPAVGAGGTNSKLKWTVLGDGKALFHRTKVGGGATGVTVDLVAASSSGITLTTVTDLDWSTDYNAFGPGTPKVEGASAYTAYGANEFVLIDSSYDVTEPFAPNSTDDYDAGLWNNIGDGYSGVAKIGTQFVLVQTSASTVDFYFDDGTITSVAEPDGGSFPLGTGQLIGVASGYAALWVVDDSGHVHTFQVSLPPADIAPGPGRIRFAG
jgi:hypothetical protein